MENDFVIRYSTVNDIHGMGIVYVDTWKAAYQGMIPQDYLDGLTYESWEEKYRARFSQITDYNVAVLDLDGRIIGVTSMMKTRDDDLPDSFGEIVSIYVLPEYWHQGLGKMMLEWAVKELKKQGFTDCVLWTLEDNHRARRAYEHFGFERDGARKSQEFCGKDVWEIRYRMRI